jgi:hypothetical protein
MFRLVALSSFLVASTASAAAGGAVSSAAALRDLMQSSPQDSLASFQNAIRSTMASDLLSREEDHSFFNDRNLISQTCANEMGEALQSSSLVDVSGISEETLQSACSFDLAMTEIQCDASKISDANGLVAETCDSNGHVYAEATYVLSMTNGTVTSRYEINNMGICVGSSCSEDEVSDFFDLYTELFQQLLGPLDDDTAPEVSISFTLEGIGSSSSRIMWSSSIFASAVAVGLMLFWA